MPANCGILFSVREEIVHKLENINSSIEGIEQNLAAAEIALGGAAAGAGMCYWAGPAVAVCLATAAVAFAAASAAVAYFASKLSDAKEAQGQAQQALDEVDGLLSHCEALPSGMQEQADAMGEEGRAYLAMVPDPPDGDDTSALDEAEAALAELENFGEGKDDSYA